MPLSPPAQRNLIIAGAVLLALAVAAPFAWTYVKQQRAAAMADDAKALLEEEKFGEAWEKARAAYALHDEVEIGRLVAELTDQMDPPAAPKLWRSLYERTGEEQDAWAWFDSQFRVGDADALQEIVAVLASDYPESPEALIRRARLARAQEQPLKALELAKKAARQPSASGDIQLAYIQLSQLSDDLGVQRQGIAFLKEMTKRDDETGLIALRNYLLAPGLSGDEILDVAKQLANHPKAERQDKLQEIVLRRNIDNQPVDELLAEAKSLFELDNAAELVELGRWLNQNGRSDDVLDIVDLETAMKRRDLFLVWADAMALEGKWQGLETVIKRSRLPIEPFLQKLFDARIKAERGNDAIADLTWSRTILDAKDDAGKLELAYNYATKLGWTEKARAVLVRLSALPNTQRKAFEELLKLDQERGDVNALQEVLTRMAEAYPKDTDVANDLAYTNLLLNQNVQAASETAARLVNESEKPYLAHLITLALAQYRLGRRDLALDQLYTLPINWEEVRPGWRAIYAAILAANGHNRESYSIMSGVDAEALLPPEREILRQAREG